MLEAKYITEPETLRKYRDEILSAPVLGIDTETTGLDPLINNVRLLQIATSPERAFVVDLKKEINVMDDSLNFVRDILADRNKVKIFHNAKFDQEFLIQDFGAEKFASVFDTYLASVLVNCGDDSIRNDLATVAKTYAGVALDKKQQLSDFGAEHLTQSQIEYSAIDAAVLLEVREGLNKYLRTQELCRVAALEFDAVESVARMELDGFYLDEDEWSTRIKRQTEELATARTFLVEHFKTVSEVSLFGEISIDPESPTQVLAGLKKLGVPVDETTGEPKIKHLAKDYPVIRDLLAYREISTALKMFGTEYLKFVHKADGRIHADFKQIGTPTGRFTCYEPNLMQVPKEGVYRNSFKAQGADRRLVIADFSQIELRILAEFSRDERLLEVFSRGDDLHTFTASHLFGILTDAVDEKQRFIGKSANFATAYGAGAKRFAQVTGLTVKEAEEVLKKFWSVYSGLDRYLKECEERAITELESHSYSGRTWRFDCDLNDNQAVGAVRRLGRNFPIQATCSDILKRSLHLICESFRGTNSKIVNAVHDELVIECDTSNAEETQRQVLAGMMSASEEVLSAVPCKVDSKISEVWSK